MRFKIISLLFLVLLINVSFAKEYSKIYVINIDGIINSVMSSFVVNSIEKIEKNNDGIIIIRIDTPGGLLESMREIVLKIMNTKIPVIGYIYPEGARAASAGAFIMLACDVVVMAPTSNIGAAHPVNLGKKIDSVMEEKIVNDTVAFITGIAKKRGKNQRLAKLMVTKSISITAREAVRKNIADFIANNLFELKAKLENYKIKKNGKTIRISVKNAVIRQVNMNLLESFLFKISHPNIAYILLLLGIYGIMAEFSTPGIGFPGVVGSICLILAFFALNTLPINLAGLLLIVLSIILFILELKIQSGGILGVGAAVSFILGSVMLMRTSTKFLKISPSIIVSAAIFTIGFFVLLLVFGIKIQFAKSRTGREGIIGATGYAKTDIKPQGEVLVNGERWQAISYRNQQINKDEPIEVVDIKNLRLVVKKAR